MTDISYLNLNPPYRILLGPGLSNVHYRVQVTQTHQEAEFTVFGVEPMLKLGTWSVEITEELKPQKGDIVVQNFSHDPFYETRLDQVLQKLVPNPTCCCAVVTGGAINVCADTIEWECKDENMARFYSVICGSAERLPNGNTLICESTKGRIFEVTAGKEIVWEFINPFYRFRQRLGWTNYIFRAHRYGYDSSEVKGGKLDPDRFEWILREKGKPDAGEYEKEKARKLKSRLSGLGY